MSEFLLLKCGVVFVRERLAEVELGVKRRQGGGIGYSEADLPNEAMTQTDINRRYWRQEAHSAHRATFFGACCFVFFLCPLTYGIFFGAPLVGGVAAAGVLLSLARGLVGLLDWVNARGELRRLGR